MFAPAGYWYVVAYEAVPGAPSTWGGQSYSWRSFAYYDPRRALQTGEPEATVAAAQFNHDATFAQSGSNKGAVRAYWWTGSGWQLQPSLNRDWGPRGLVGIEDEPPAPKLPQATAPTSSSSIAIPVVVVLVVGAIFWDVVAGKHWGKARG